jgi:hypothetical protein
MRTILLALISTVLINGCAWLPTRAVVLGGAKDIIDVQPGAKICGVALPTDEKDKTYCVVAQEPSRLLTMKAYSILEKSK